MKITIPGKPIAKARARIVNLHGFVRSYDPQEKQKQLVSQEISRQIKNLASDFDLNAMVTLNASFYLSAPDSATQSKRSAKLWNLESHRPDLDNLCKFYLDCANGILWKDDSQIVAMSLAKRYSNNPRTELDVMWHSTILDDSVKKIIVLFSPEELEEFIADVKKLSDLYPAKVSQDYAFYHQAYLGSCALLLSWFCKKHSKVIQKIAKMDNPDG